MRIAYFLDVPDGLGGAGATLLEQAKIMSSVHEVFVVSPYESKKKVNQDYLNRSGNSKIHWNVLKYKTFYTFLDIDLPNSIESHNNIIEFANKNHIELFHSVQLNLSVELASRELHIPHVMNIYSIAEEEFSILYPGILPRYISSDSNLYSKLWADNTGASTFCIRPSATLDAVKIKENKKNNRINLLMLGLFVEFKRQLTAIKAVEELNKEGAEIVLTIAGNDESDYGEMCKQYVVKHHLEEMVNIVGFQKDVESLLISNDCLLCVSERESFPRSIVEAMSYDLTIISTPVAGIPELLHDGENAYICKDYSVCSVKRKICEYIKDIDSSKLYRIRENARNTWKDNFDKNVVFNQLCSMYKKMLDNANGDKYEQESYSILESDIMKISEENVDIPYVYSKSYYYFMLASRLKSGTAYIWGAGNFGCQAYNIIKKVFRNIEIKGFIDIRKKGEYQGCPIIEKDDIGRDTDYIFLSFAADKSEAVSFLKALGYVLYKDIWLLP